MLGYKILLLFVLLLTGLGTVSVFRHPRRLPLPILRAIGVFLFLLYLLPWIETATNYQKESPVLAAIGPFYNLVPLLFLLVLIAPFLPFSGIRRFLYLFVSLCAPILLINGIATLLYHMKNTVNFNERTGLFVIGQICIVLFGLSLVRGRTVRIGLSGILASLAVSLGLYGGIALINAKAGTNVFGLSPGEGAYVLLPSLLTATPAVLFSLNFALPAVSVCLSGAVYMFIQKKTAPDET